MNRVKVNLNITTTTEKTMTYNVIINGSVIYTGKIFVLPGQPNISLDLTDILGNYQYKGAGMLNPTYVNGEILQPTSSTTKLGTDTSEQHYSAVTVKVYDGDLQKASTLIGAYFHTIPFNVEKGSLSNKSTYFGRMIPRLPKVNTTKLRYAQLIYTTTATSVVFTDGTNTIYTSASDKGSIVHNIPMSSVVRCSDVYFNNKKILHLDDCAAPYYLLWITSNGGLQAQPFLKSSVYTEEHSRNNKVSVDDMTDVANSMIYGKWKLRSKNLTDDEYIEMMDIVRSPYLLLYDSKLDKATYVNVSDATIEEKKMTNNSKKPVYFEINLTSREALNNIM